MNLNGTPQDKNGENKDAKGKKLRKTRGRKKE